VVTMVVNWLDSAACAQGAWEGRGQTGRAFRRPCGLGRLLNTMGEKRYTASDFTLVYDGFALDSSSPAGGGFGSDRCQEVW
jgi:hypothetical protein